MFVHRIRKGLYALRQVDIKILGFLEIQPDKPHRAEWFLCFARKSQLLFVGCIRRRLGLVALLETFRVYVRQTNVLVALQISDQIANL